NEAHHKVPPAGFKYLVTEMVGWATGGPQKYTGRSMRESHEHLNITPKEWDAFMDDFQQTLDKVGVPAVEQAELKAIVNSTYGRIVIGKSESNWPPGISGNLTHGHHWKGGQPLALSGQKHAWRGAGRIICRFLRSLWRSALCL